RPVTTSIFLHYQQSFTSRNPSSLTRRCSIRLSSIVEDSLLLPPVGVWAVSQSQCGRSVSQLGYASLPWYAVTLPTSYCTAGPSNSDSIFIFQPLVMLLLLLFGTCLCFHVLSLSLEQLTHVLLTRPPLACI